MQSFFTLTPPRDLLPTDALPGISADEPTFFALIEALHATLGQFQDDHPDMILTYGDVIHATRCVIQDLVHAYAHDEADEDDEELGDLN